MEDKEDNTKGPQASPNKIGMVSKPKEKKIIPEYDNKTKVVGSGFDVSGVPTRMRVEGQTKAKDRVNPSLSANAQAPDEATTKEKTAKALSPKSVKLDKK